MPIYDLYGKSVSVNTGNRGSKIVEMVKTRKADIGAAAISNFGDASRSNDPELRYIHHEPQYTKVRRFTYLQNWL